MSSSSSSSSPPSLTMSVSTVDDEIREDAISLFDLYRFPVHFLPRTLYRVTHPRTHYPATPRFDPITAASGRMEIEVNDEWLAAAIQTHLDGRPSWFLSTFSNKDNAYQYAHDNSYPGEEAMIHTIDTRRLGDDGYIFSLHWLEDMLDINTRREYQGNLLFFYEIPERALVAVDFLRMDFVCPRACLYLHYPRPPRVDPRISFYFDDPTTDEEIEDDIARYEVEREIELENGDGIEDDDGYT